MWNPAKYASHELQQEDYLDFRRYLLGFPWEWMVTLTFEYGIKFFPAQRMFNRWRLDLIDQEKIQFAAYMISATRNGLLHFHLLAFGSNRAGKALLDCSPRKWEGRWPYHARIEEVDDVFGACDYIAKHRCGFLADSAQIYSFNSTLLLRSMVGGDGELW